MRGDIERVKLQLLEAYEDGEAIDIGAWAGEHPDAAAELVDYWMWLSGTPRVSDVIADPDATPSDDVIESTLRDACLAVSFGPQWLEESVEVGGRTDADLGSALEKLRSKPPYTGRGAPPQFRKAVVYAWIIRRLAMRRERVTRLAVQKTAYLLEDALNCAIFVEHGQKRLGPYDYKARYKDAEPIGIRKKWLVMDGTTLLPGPASAEVSKYVGKYVRSEALAALLVERLARLPDDELELWATTAWATRDLRGSGITISVQTVQEYLGRTEEWKEKVNRSNFTSSRIAGALERLERLRLL